MEEAAAQITDWLIQTAPPGTAAACGTIGPSDAFDEQEAASVALAVDRRRNEYLTGRTLARHALADLCCPPQSIPVGEERMPIWPPGFVGSISHCTGMCVAHVGNRDALMGIGVDVERSQAVTPDMFDYVCTAAERDRLATIAGAEAYAATLAFSAKEAFYKAYYPIARVFLEFTDVELQVDWPSRSFLVSLSSAALPAIAGCRCLKGRFSLIGPFVVTAVWVATPARLTSVKA